MNLFNWVAAAREKIRTWFALKSAMDNYNESVELMCQTLAEKSWFDKLSSSWIAQGFWLKMGVVSVLSIFSGLIGLGQGTSMFFALSALVVLIGVHCLLLAHERHRLKQADVILKETLLLNENLEQNKEEFAQALQAVDSMANRLITQGTHLENQANGLLVEESQVLAQHHEVLVVQFKVLSDLIPTLMAQEKKLQGALADIAEFTESVTDVQRCQIAYSDAVRQFGIFVSAQKIYQGPELLDESPHSIDALNVEMEETDRFIEALKQHHISYSFALQGA